MPRADDVPIFKRRHRCSTPCTHNPLGVKGCGEAGAIGSPPAVINAVIDALTPLGVQATSTCRPRPSGSGRRCKRER